MDGEKWTITLKTRHLVKYLLQTNSNHKKVSTIKGLNDGGLIYNQARNVIKLLHSRFSMKSAD
ncbi:hypothetical protein L1D55_01175 [Vibrio sp. Isolate22]|uniref:hypothetical protein n=1 Tax=Vibrio sp. Isolate22 TaxID=2908532 RepID=UPI001EFD0062|nr:hypothetical protein [Vibrio sp. Isolate22]MCG9690424.1 hypothetical protein [Vibrio sp. Isolate22]